MLQTMSVCLSGIVKCGTPQYGVPVHIVIAGDKMYRLIAKCFFGLEKTLSFEIKGCGGENLTVTDGQIIFDGDSSVIAKTNMSCRVAERVGVLLAQFPAVTFDDVFDSIKVLPLRDILPKNAAFPVKAGHSLNSALTSIPALQRTVKKALVYSLTGGKNYTLAEDGAVYPVTFTLRNNVLQLILDTSGENLHKRGYRTAATASVAPLRETLAAGIVDLCRIKQYNILIDPFCGSGTILIEAALRARCIPPNLRRHFVCGSWTGFGGAFAAAREELSAKIVTDTGFTAHGYDIDPAAVQMTLHNAKTAGVTVTAETRAIRDTRDIPAGAVIVTNPPYGERLSEQSEVTEIYKTMGTVLGDSARVAALSPRDDFPALFGKPFKNRKLYNGKLQVRLFLTPA